MRQGEARTLLPKIPYLASEHQAQQKKRVFQNWCLEHDGAVSRLAFDGGRLTPTAELGVRHDQTGFGLDLSGGLNWSAPALGLAAHVSGHGLLTYEDAGFHDWEVAGSLSYSPTQGLSLPLAPTRAAQPPAAPPLCGHSPPSPA